MKNALVKVNGRTCRWMERPLVVVCVDGCEPDYITQAIQADAAPYLRELCEKGSSNAKINEIIARLAVLPGVEGVYDRANGCRRFELPEDRMGDIIIVSERHVVLGTNRHRHDLSGLDVPLRSHGGVSEKTVPLLFNHRTNGGDRACRSRNFDIFDIALNRLD